ILALKTSQFCNKMLRLMADGGPSIDEQLQDLKARVEAAKPGDVVDDEHDIINFLLKNLTRPAVQKGCKRKATAVRDVQMKKARTEKEENVESAGVGDVEDE
ncbi:unnamed protein product, partial [Ectocarpus sp. 12 AP-2014]